MSCKWCCFPVDCSCPIGLIRRYSSRAKNRKIVLLLVGLDNAGKSSTAKGLAREPVDDTVPTVGFNSITLKHRGFTVLIYDLGGSSQIRGIWHRYFVDVHGIIFVVDASDLLRIDESRKVLEELLAHDKLAGKPLLLLANKQDREGALDEIDIVERLNVESLVNQQKCPTLVETCSAAGAPGGHKPHLDSGIQNGYRWLMRRIISDYDLLNARVEQDMEKERLVHEAERQEWLKRQDTDHQIDSIPSEYEENPFKPISTLVNGHVSKLTTENHVNGHVVQVEPLSESGSNDSPDGSSHTVEEEGVYIPLHSPTSPSPPTPHEPDVLVVSQPQPADVVLAVKEQFEWKMQKQKKKLLVLRSNRTAPTSAKSFAGERVLPPLKTTGACNWARPSTAKSLPSQGWGLGLSLEEVNPPQDSSLKLEVLQSARTLATTSGSDTDDNDVICVKSSGSS
ncbi:ADP-ribosylation factor-like protein 13B [Homalodisca vitripennis]|uniref:ADP-ribosylation factor-like protein 13B n=1 Tax=Homalodisca vitripennis TaxID=197043 RepID=UPI001EEA0288|nr:ADP-ribosylation factor-like protein 13B [Homalodisca vitripennis]XP_046667229.1 ADP-ribosylation factor-like protein 13B [Homalodisca vitripennis]XP_046667230.1 ADP-ribosylation factor-like protein 13B [Homalodisca vitripennis]